MTPQGFADHCIALPQSTHVVQWGNADVWKIGGKVYAIGRAGEDGVLAVTFKTSEMMFELLRDRPGCRPAPYLASRGLSWIQRHGADGPDGDELADLITRSYEMVRAGLSKKMQAALTAAEQTEKTGKET